MNMTAALAGISLTVMSLGAQAHAHLTASDPKEGAVLTQMPGKISLTFSESARITVIAIQKDHEVKQVLKAPTSVGETLGVVVPALSPGAYTLSWRVVSTDDNHIMGGELHFTLSAATPSG